MEKQQQVEKLLTDILTLMEFPARLDFKDASDGSLAVAMHFTGEVPAGIAPGKKSYLVDSLQFLLNKCINRPNTERRWVSLGVGGFPEPRAARPAGAPAAAAPAASPAASPAAAPASPASRASPAAQARPPQAAQPPRNEKSGARGGVSRPPEVDESKLEVPEDPAMAALGAALAEKSARLGRLYAVPLLSLEDRVRLLKGAKGVEGVTVRVEGEAHFRRVAFVPGKATAMPKRHAMAVYPDDEDEGE